MKTTKKAVVSGLAMIGAAALLAGCGAAPESNGASGGAAAGASDYIAKPIDVEQLLSLMRVWMPK